MQASGFTKEKRKKVRAPKKDFFEREGVNNERHSTLLQKKGRKSSFIQISERIDEETNLSRNFDKISGFS